MAAKGSQWNGRRDSPQHSRRELLTSQLIIASAGMKDGEPDRILQFAVLAPGAGVSRLELGGVSRLLIFLGAGRSAK